MSMKRGSILAEAALVMPLLMLLIFGIIQFALIWTAKQMTAYAAFCATRAITVVPPGEQDKAAQDAAEVALSWMCIADKGQAPVSIPGWGGVNGSGSSNDRVKTKVLPGCNGAESPIAAVEVKFKYPLIIPGMSVNKILANRSSAVKDAEERPDFYKEQYETAVGADTSMDDHWPWLELTETCVLPMPYSTANFPTGGFEGTSLTGGGS